METTSRKSQNPVGQPAVQSLSCEGSRNAKAAEKEEDEMMGEPGKGLWDNGLGISTEDSGQNSDYGDEQGGDGEGIASVSQRMAARARIARPVRTSAAVWASVSATGRNQ